MRPAPAVDRVTKLFGYLAAKPTERLTLSEIARRLDFNKATCSTMLNSLTDAGYLLRDTTDRTYRLGPALLALSDAARVSFSSSELRDEMHRLRDDLDLECLASTVVNDELVVLDRAGQSQMVGLLLQPGQRLPLVPPLGTVFMAWAEPAQIERWLRRVGPGSTDQDLQHCLAAVDAVRARGYAVALESMSFERLRRELAEASSEHRRQTAEPSLMQLFDGLAHEQYLLVNLEQAAEYRVNHIAAPVFGPSGRVDAALTVLGFRDQLDALQIPRYAERLLNATRRVTAAMGGTEPDGASSWKRGHVSSGGHQQRPNRRRQD